MISVLDLKELYLRGAHFMKVRKESKFPVRDRKYAMHHPELFDDVEEWHKDGGRIGLVPASLGLVVIDVDAYEMEARVQAMKSLEHFGFASAVVDTPKKGLHLYYYSREANLVPDMRWLWGDILGFQGYAIIYDTTALMGAIRGSAIGSHLTLKDLVELPDTKLGPSASAGRERSPRRIEIDDED